MSELIGQPWDVVVIGAGPAGAVAAVALADAGLRTLLVERKAFPRSKVCGGCLNMRAIEALKRLGLELPDADWCAGEIATLELRTAGRSARIPLPGGRVVERGGFDAWLASQAEARGATFVSQTSATVGEVVGDYREVRLQTCDSLAPESATIQARMVIAADGLGGGSLPAAASGREVASSSHLGAGATIEGAELDLSELELPPRTIAMHVGRQGYVGVAGVSPIQVNVAAALAPTFVRDRGGLGPAVVAILEESLGAPLQSAIRERLLAAPWQGVPLLTTRRRQVAGERLLLLGDAAGYVEPFTGEGMAWAIDAAAAAAPLVFTGVERWRPELAADWTRRHAQIVRRGWCTSLSWLLRRPWLVGGAIRALRIAPWLAGPAVQGVHTSRRFAETPP